MVKTEISPPDQIFHTCPVTLLKTCLHLENNGQLTYQYLPITARPANHDIIKLACRGSFLAGKAAWVLNRCLPTENADYCMLTIATEGVSAADLNFDSFERSLTALLASCIHSNSWLILLCCGHLGGRQTIR